MRRERKREETEFHIIFLVFCGNSRTWFVRFFRHVFTAGLPPPSQSSPKMRTVIFSCLHIVMSYTTDSLFLFSITRPFPQPYLWLSFRHSESGTDLGQIQFYFWLRRPLLSYLRLGEPLRLGGKPLTIRINIRSPKLYYTYKQII